jgi:hypothetical protein
MRFNITNEKKKKKKKKSAKKWVIYRPGKRVGSTGFGFDPSGFGSDGFGSKNGSS